ncbi:unnamed protein product [Lactuca saligna]|uniref:Uncharacterized protein n=1 Tax=Lactuca saligna TaxID=75948 RepID=A0AA35ZR01_LACSI|nr:unnamed protein product [Lactuca saligna]
MAKEVATLHHDYSSFYTIVDIIVDVVTNLVKWYNSFIPKFDTKGESDAQEVAVLKAILNNLTMLVSKVGSSSFELLTPKFLTQKFRLLGSVIHTKLAPHETGQLYANGCPPVHTGWKGGGEDGVGMGSKVVIVDSREPTVQKGAYHSVSRFFDYGFIGARRKAKARLYTLISNIQDFSFLILL